MIRAVRPEEKDLQGIVKVAKECIIATTGTEGVDKQLEHFFRNAVTNLNYFFEVIKDGDEVKGLGLATLQKTLYNDEVSCNIMYSYCEPGYEQELNTMFEHGLSWAKENNVSKAFFSEFDTETRSTIPKGFKQIGTIYGIDL